MSKKALIAMSGGVDSSVAAYLTKAQGYDCRGATMKLFDNAVVGLDAESACCSLADVEDARSVARRLGIPYNVFNFAGCFKEKVIDRFVAAYAEGATPNPCIDCNRYLKFEQLYQRARELSCDYVVTGHYARIEQDAASGRWLLRRALDPNKDQSYVLYTMTQEQLAHTLFPLGGLRKAEVREIARAQGFQNAAKRESQDICFVPDGRYADFIRRYTGRDFPPGDFIDAAGHVLGRHRGIIHYTVGQRRGLGLALGEPVYVTGIDAARNTVSVGPAKELEFSRLTLQKINLIAVENLPSPLRCTVKIRYNQKAQPALARQTGPDELVVEFERPQRAAARGQSAVIYQDDTVIGGGIII